MKLINKLLPIATLAATASVVVPLTTSCGNAGWINGKDKVDTTGWSQYTKGGTYSTTEDKYKVAIDYLKDVMNDQSIAQRDFTWSVNETYTLLDEALGKLLKDEEEPKKLTEDEEEPSKFIKSYTINDYAGKLTNIKVDEVSSNATSYYLTSFENGIKLNMDLVLDGKIGPEDFQIAELAGTLHINAWFNTHYQNILGQVDFKNEPLPDDDTLSMILSFLFGLSEKYETTTFRANVYQTIKPKEYGLDIPTPNWEFGFDGGLDIVYENHNDNRLNMNLHFDGAKTYNKTNIADTAWDEDLLTNVALVLTGQWHSYYLNNCAWKDSK